jgi:selenocysteine lyase/cysteine desulfurase
MADVQDEFGPFEGRVWLNCAHQGPLPHVARDAAEAAIHEKTAPHLISDDAFWDLPEQLRASLASLVGAGTDEVILGNATSYGLNLLCHGVDLQPGDEVLLVDGDFPATVVSWLPLRKQGVHVRLMRPDHGAPTADEVEAAIGPRTRVFCSSWVFSFTGHVLDLAEIGAICRAHDVLSVVNGSQAIGARPIDVGSLPIDALVCAGFKWLCGPYGTGFCWMKRTVMESLRYEQGYWLAQLGARDLTSEGGYELSAEKRVQNYDVFCPANFFNFKPWLAAIKLFLDLGVDTVASHDQRLVAILVDGLARLGVRLVSPRAIDQRSTLVCFEHEDTEHTRLLYEALGKRGIDVAMRNDSIRISPHLYNTQDDIELALDVIEAAC